MPIPTEPPAHAAVLAELKLLREKGLTRLGQLDLPALEIAGRIATEDEAAAEGAVIEAVLRRAVERFGGGDYGEAAALLYGLDQGTRTASSRLRRELAAGRIGRSADTFRKRYEATMLAEIAAQVLTLCTEQHTRQARLNRQQNHPAESGMAVEWLRRFESYYRIWTPIYALAADLTAYRSTLLEHSRPYDRRFGSTGADDPGYSQEEQAEGYASAALYHCAHFEWELRQFIVRSGGLWLLSDSDAEQALADAVYSVQHHTPWNERDQSLLRTLIADTPGQEMHGFLERLRATQLGRTTEGEWQEWAARCDCSWKSSDPIAEYFPTAPHHEGISSDCELHQVISASNSYCDLVDNNWRTIADWYHLADPVQKGVSAETLHARRSPRVL